MTDVNTNAFKLAATGAGVLQDFRSVGSATTQRQECFINSSESISGSSREIICPKVNRESLVAVKVVSSKLFFL